jgi:hypothetical protein
MASAMAGGAKRNSINVAAPAMYPPNSPNARCAYAKGPPALGIAVVSSVKLKIKAVYMVATRIVVARNPKVPALAHP